MRTLYFILLALWFVLGYFLCKKHICDASTTPKAKTELAGGAAAATANGDCTKLTIKDSGTEFSRVSENFQFNLSSDAYLTPSEDFSIILSDIKDYLGENPDRLMQIKGYYLEDEENTTSYDNLGLARANNVKTYFLELGVKSPQLLTIGKSGNVSCVDGDVLQRGTALVFGPVQ